MTSNNHFAFKTIYNAVRTISLPILFFGHTIGCWENPNLMFPSL